MAILESRYNLIMVILEVHIELKFCYILLQKYDNETYDCEIVVKLYSEFFKGLTDTTI